MISTVDKYESNRTLWLIMADRRGFSLLAVMWVMAILSILTGSLAFAVRMETKITRWRQNNTLSYYTARAGIHRTAAIIGNHAGDECHTLTDTWRNDETVYQDIPFGEGRYSIYPETKESEDNFGIDDEESRLNINVATPEMLMQFEGIASWLAEDLVLYRLKSSGKGLSQPLASQNKSGKKKNEEKSINSPITHLSQLLAVKGLTSEMLSGRPGDTQSGIAQYLTCFSSGRVNINTAKPAVLKALGFQDEEINTILSRRRGNEPGYISVDRFLTDLNISQKRKKRMKPFLDVRSRHFRFSSMARFNNSGPMTRISVLMQIEKERITFPEWRVNI